MKWISKNKTLVGIAMLIMLFAGMLLFRLGTIPNVFIDEGSTLYDGWCLANYGVDSNLNKNPIYLQSLLGQGQSVLYAYLVHPVFKLLNGGVNIFWFRFPLVLLAIISVVLLSYVLFKQVNRKIAFFTSLVIVTSPYIIMMTRYGMDCNVAFYPFIIGFSLIVLGGVQSGSRSALLSITLGFLFVGISNYGYNAAWLFTPAFVICSVIILWHKNYSFKSLLVSLVPLLLTNIPIIIFAIRSNVPKWNHTIHFLGLTCPRLLESRGTYSLIKFNGNVFNNMLINLKNGLMMFLHQSDGLRWNSIPGISPLYPFVIVFFVIGCVEIIKHRTAYNDFLIILAISAIPTILLITPNFNHWMYPIFLIVLVSGLGLTKVCQNSNSIVFSILIVYVLFTCFFWYSILQRCI